MLISFWHSIVAEPALDASSSSFVVFGLFFFFSFLVHRREIVIWDLIIDYVSDFKFQRLDLKNNYEFTIGS